MILIVLCIRVAKYVAHVLFVTLASAPQNALVSIYQPHPSKTHMQWTDVLTQRAFFEFPCVCLCSEEQARHQGQRALMLKRDVQSGIDFDDLLRHFDDVQALRAQSQSTAGPTPASPLRLQQPAQKP